MPPEKRQRPLESQPIASPAASNSQQREPASSSPSHPSTSFAHDEDEDAPPFLNTTFTTHRVSPLYVGAHPLSQDRLDTLSQRLRDLLVGDVVRGVEVGLDRGADDAALRRAGALELVAMGWVRLETLVGRFVGKDGDETVADETSLSLDSAVSSPGKRRGLQIYLQYENAECAALLLPASRSSPSVDAPAGIASDSMFGFGVGRPDDDDPGFLRLPLMLLRMPAPLRSVIIDFVGRTFDCRISSLSLGTRSLVGALERWLGDSRIPTRGPFAKDVMLTLGFHAPTVTQHQRQKQGVAAQADRADEEEADGSKVPEITMGLKSIEVVIPNSDLRRFVRAASNLEAGLHAEEDTPDMLGHAKRRRLGGDKDEESWTWRRSKKFDSASEDIQPQPFTEALAQYIRKHLALDMFHPAVRVTKIACGGFALSEGRVKIFGAVPSGEQGDGLSDPEQRAVWAVLEGLLERAQVKPLDRTLIGVDRSILPEGKVQRASRTGSTTNVESSMISSETG